MKNDKQLNAKVLIVTAKELNTDSKDRHYTFRVLEFENGLILVEGHTTNDWYFEDRSCIEPNGNEYRDWETDRKSTRLNSSH